MKKNKNIKNKNLKLSNFVIKLGMVSTVVGTVAASVGVSKAEKNKTFIIDGDVNLSSKADSNDIKGTQKPSELIHKGTEEKPKDNGLQTSGVWDTRISSNDVFENIASQNHIANISEKNINDSINGFQNVEKVSYDFTTSVSRKHLSINTDNWNSRMNAGVSSFCEDSEGNLWAISASQKIVQFDYNTQKWNDSDSGNLLLNGDWGQIFEDSNHTLWAVGFTLGNKPIQYNYNTKKWVAGPNKGFDNKDASTAQGWAPKIFEDDHKIIWLSQSGCVLQKYDLKNPGAGWTSSKIDNAVSFSSQQAIFFQDSFGTLWTFQQKGLQKYDRPNDNWVTQGSSEGSNITNGNYASIFEDSNCVLWAMSSGSKLQKLDLKNKASKWEISPTSKITNGTGGVIFEDSYGYLWSAAEGSKLQKLDLNLPNAGWIEQTKENSGSNIKGGKWANVFEDSQGTLWSIAYGDANGQFLQESDDGGKTWHQAGGAITNQKTINTYSSSREFIFEDSKGILWYSHPISPLQFKLPGEKTWNHYSALPKGLTGNAWNNGDTFEDSRGHLWMGTHKGIFYSSDHGKTWVDKSKESGITNMYDGTIMEDDHGFIWFMGCGFAKYEYNTNGGSWEIQNPSITSGDILQDSHGNLWATGQDKAMYKYDYNAKTWSVDATSNYNSGRLGKIFQYKDILWSIGSNVPSGKGYMGATVDMQRYDWVKKTWESNIDKNNGLMIKSGYSASFTADTTHDCVWVLSAGTPPQKFDYKTGKWTTKDKFDIASPADFQFSKIFRDSHDNLWLSTPRNKLFKYDDNKDEWMSQTNFPITDLLAASIFEDSKGTLWVVSGMNNGILKSDDQGKNWKIISPLSTSTYPAYHTHIFEDSSGTIWINKPSLSAKNASDEIPISYRYSDPIETGINEFKGEISLKSFIRDGNMYLSSMGLKRFSKIPGVKIKYSIPAASGSIDWTTKQEWKQGYIPLNKIGIYTFHFEMDTSIATITKDSLPKDFSIEVDKKVNDAPTIKQIVKQPTHNGGVGTLSYGKFTNPNGAKLQVSKDGGPFVDADENGFSVNEKVGSLALRWKLDDYCYWDSKKEPIMRELIIGNIFPSSGDLDKNYEDIIESKVQHIFKDVNFDFEDWTVDSFNALKSNTIKHIKLSNSASDLTADLEVLIHADSEHKLSYKILKVQYDTKGSKISSDFYPVITKELMGAKGYITPSYDLSTQQEAQGKVLAKAKKELTDALGKITFDKIHDTAYEALVKNLPATWNPVSEKVSLSHQGYKVEVKKTIDSKNGKIVLKLNVFQPPISRAVASDKIEIQGFLGLDSLLTKQTELEDRIKEIFGKTSGIDKLTTGVFNADLNNVTKKISIKGYAKTHLDLTVHIKATADDKLSYTIDPKVIIKDDNVDVKETLAPTIFSTISNWHNDITVAPKFLSYADIKAKASKQTIEAELTKGLTKFEPSTKISIKINDDYYLDLVLDLSEASSTELRYEIDSFALKYKGNDLPDAQSSPELKSLIGLSEKMSVSSAIQGTFPTLEALKDLASKPIDSYVLEKFKYFDFQDWTVDSFNSQPANRTAKIRIYGENDTSAELEISVTADSEKIISYKVTNVIVKEKGVQKIGGPFQSISDDFAAKSGQTQTHDDFRTEKEAQLKAADKAKDDMRIAIGKMTFDKAELPSESKPKVFAGWKGQDKYEAYHQEFDVTYNQVPKDSTGEIIVTSTVAPFTKTGPKKCTPESVTNTIGGFMGITQLTNMQSKVKQAILDEFAKQHLNELTSYFFNKDTKNNVMEVVIDGFGDTTAELTLKLDATADDKLSYTVMDVVVKNGIKVVPDSTAGNAISELKKWTGDVDLNPGFLTEEEYEKNLAIKNFKANPNELASEVINAKNTGVSKAVKGEYEFENADFRIDYTPDDESGEVLGKVTRKGSSSNVQETISGFLKFKAFADAVKTKDLESKLLSALDKCEDSKTFNFKINDDYTLELTVAVLPKDDNTISYSVSGFDVKHNGKSLSNAQNSAILRALLKIKGDIKVLETNTKLLDVIYEKLHGESRRLDMSQLTKATSIPKPKPTIDLDEVTKELGEFYVSGEQSGSAKLSENNAPDATGFEFEFQVIDDEKPLSEPTKTLPVNLKNGEHVKITSVLKDGYQVKGKMPEKDIPVANLKEDKSIDAAKLTKATEIKEVPEIKEFPEAAKPASKSNGLMIGLVVAGSVTGLILIGLLAFMIAKKRKKRS